jgi:hypothetical protein
MDLAAGPNRKTETASKVQAERVHYKWALIIRCTGVQENGILSEN